MGNVNFGTYFRSTAALRSMAVVRVMSISAVLMLPYGHYPEYPSHYSLTSLTLPEQAQPAAANGAAQVPASHADARDAGSFDKTTYPIARPIAAPTVEIDSEATPDQHALAEHAAAIIEQWFPIVCQFLSTSNFTPPHRIKITFRSDIMPPAYTTGFGTDEPLIVLNSKYFALHPNEFGIVIHEMTHIIQGHTAKGPNPLWLLEGIADYIRFYRYEPDVARPRIDPESATFRDSYRTTAAFLAWVSGTYDRGLIAALDQALREGSYTDDLFLKRTDKSVEALWKEFVDTLPRRRFARPVPSPPAPSPGT